MEGKCDAATKLINSNFEMGLFSRDAIFYLFFPALMIWAIVMGLSHSGTPTRPDSVQIGRVSWITQMVQGTELRPGDRLCVDKTCHQAFSIIEGCKLEFCHGVLCGVVRQFNAHVSMNCQLKLDMDGRVRLTHPTYRTNVDIIPGIFTALRPGADGILYGSLFGGGQDVVIADGSDIKYRSQRGQGPMGPSGGYPFQEHQPGNTGPRGGHEQAASPKVGATGPGGAAGSCHHERGPVGRANAEIERKSAEENAQKAKEELAQRANEEVARRANAELARQEKELKAFVADEENKMLEELRKRYVDQRKELHNIREEAKPFLEQPLQWHTLEYRCDRPDGCPPIAQTLEFRCDRPDGCKPLAIPIPFEINSLKVTDKTVGAEEYDPDEL